MSFTPNAPVHGSGNSDKVTEADTQMYLRNAGATMPAQVPYDKGGEKTEATNESASPTQAEYDAIKANKHNRAILNFRARLDNYDAANGIDRAKQPLTDAQAAYVSNAREAYSRQAEASGAKSGDFKVLANNLSADAKPTANEAKIQAASKGFAERLEKSRADKKTVVENLRDMPEGATFPRGGYKWRLEGEKRETLVRTDKEGNEKRCLAEAYQNYEAGQMQKAKEAELTR